METEIGPLGYSIRLKTLPGHFLQNIRNELYVKPAENPNFPSNESSYPVFRISKNSIYLPRYYGITEYSKPGANVLGDGEPINVTFNGSLRPIQETTISETVKNFELFGGGLVSLDTGLGKTVVALKLISIMKTKTLVLVHAEFLLDQWVERAKTFLPGARIGIIQQDRCEYVDCDIVVGMIQSIIKRDYPKECFRSFGHLIIDECHHIGSKTFSSIFFKVQTKYMLGLSATPERKDGLSKVIYWFLGPQIVHFKREIGKPSVVFVTSESEIVEKFNKLGKVNIPTMVTDLTANPERNELIIKIVQDKLHESRKILILTDRRLQCDYLLQKLTDLKISAGIYVGGLTREKREESVTKSVIIGTYQASGEGFDVPELDTLVLASPKSDVEQAVGRILRQKNKNDPVVIDIVDQFSIFKGQYYKRKKFYKSNNYNCAITHVV